MQILLPFGVAFAGLIMLTMMPDKTTLMNIVAISMLLGGIGVTIYNAKHRGF